jgi:hypothetical protein
VDDRVAIVDDLACLKLSGDKNDDDDDDDDDNDEGYIRLKTVSRNDVVRVVALKLDLHYWGSWKLARDDSTISGWLVMDA